MVPPRGAGQSGPEIMALTCAAGGAAVADDATIGAVARAAAANGAAPTSSMATRRPRGQPGQGAARLY